ncbi:FG-GAP repeat domain-containing protein [Streptomyces sp. NBC_01264]|uniref:FG-GAP repeat domain-containing protein n=1 Tax=Streptomyces sp. NBC_01264 TaxID=2903804 RepID=UPI002251AC56|nr:VCBS repeat-containing protein [Streptomyces sp. NBC_01264]MCX4783658.1 VCBS repeat-containing protein [Streptomyces sp. NBC_01264]
MNSVARRGLVAATAIVVAMGVAAGSAFAAGDPAAAAALQKAKQQAQSAPSKRAAVSVAAPTFPLYAVNKKNSGMDLFFPNGKGGLDLVANIGYDFSGLSDAVDVDNDNDGYGEATWIAEKNGRLTYAWVDGAGESQERQVGTGYHIYAGKLLSPGQLGGGKEADLLGVDKAGVLWEYLAYPNGSLTARIKIGAGWGQYSQIAGQGDLTGDGKADIVARDTSGVLWLYKGTGNYAAPFAPRTKIGAGWNIYDRLVSVGDLNADGKTDLVARKSNGSLYRYSGTGNASAPFKKPVKIGSGFQVYNIL